MSSIYSWSVTAADNDDADGDINWAEGQNPSTVNNSARQVMGRVAERIADQGPVTAGGTADALTLTANSAFTALANGLQITLKAASDNTGAATLNVNALGTKAIRKIGRSGSGDAALAAGDIQTGGLYDLRYDAAANSAAGAWILMSPAHVALDEANTWSAAQTFSETVVINESTTSVDLNNDSGNSRGVIATTATPTVILRAFTVEGGAMQGANIILDGAAGTVNANVGTLQQAGVNVVTETGTQTLTNKTLTSPSLTSPTLTGSATAETFQADTLGVTDNLGAGSQKLNFRCNETLTADRNINFIVHDSLRTIDLNGSLTLAANLVTSGTSQLTLTTVGLTDVTLPQTGTLVAVSTASVPGVTDFPVGHTLVAQIDGSSPPRNGSVTLALHNSDNTLYVDSLHANAGTALSGTWRSSGRIAGATSMWQMRRVS